MDQWLQRVGIRIIVFSIVSCITEFDACGVRPILILGSIMQWLLYTNKLYTPSTFTLPSKHDLFQIRKQDAAAFQQRDEPPALVTCVAISAHAGDGKRFSQIQEWMDGHISVAASRKIGSNKLYTLSTMQEKRVSQEEVDRYTEVATKLHDR